jgi:hypothetical protein
MRVLPPPGVVVAACSMSMILQALSIKVCAPNRAGVAPSAGGLIFSAISNAKRRDTDDRAWPCCV